MKIVLISDTHSLHQDLIIPKGDMIIHAGDFTNVGSPVDVVNFLWWFNNLGFKYSLCISGNHDLLAEDHPQVFKKFLDDYPNITYLQDSSATIEGIKFYGSPFTPLFNNWAFMLERGAEMKTVWDKIDKDTDVLITHGGPLGYMDEVFNPKTSECDEHVGCVELLKALDRLKVKHHIFGHLHESYGKMKYNKTSLYNVSSCDDSYKIVNPPVVIEV